MAETSKKKKSKNEVRPRRLVLLDAHAILHRAYHALPDFSSSRGEPTGALYGLSTMLIKIIGELKPDYMIACYDLPEPTYRHEAFEDYKSGRKAADNELVLQMDRSRDVFKAFHAPIYAKPGFEADDILGTIVEKLSKEKDIEIIIASGDMDTLQLISGKKVRVYTLKKGIKDTIIYDEDGVKERFGFGPELLPDYKGLRGDPSDNIPGVRGIGEKTATTLITTFGSIDEIYKVLKKNPEKIKEAGITERIIGLLKENEEEARFSKMLGTIRRDAPIEFSLPEKPWKEGISVPEAEELFDRLEFRAMGQRLKEVLGGKKLPEKATQSSFNDLSQDVPAETVEELKVAVWLLDSSRTNPTADDVLRYAKTKSFAEAKNIIFDAIQKQSLGRVFEEIEKPLIPVVKKMEKRGIKVDTEYLSKLAKEYHKKLEELERNIWKEAGEEFNINSPKQIGEVLFDKLGLSLKNHKKTSTGVKSTRESELEKMKEMHPVVPLILKHRELQKLLSTYIDNIPTMLSDDGRLHARFLSAGTTTGRMSSSDPNLQNIPIKSDQGRTIRKGFVAEKGFLLATLDYSQIELRVAAILSGDKKLMRIFKEGGDIHTAVASEVFRVAPDDVTAEMRRRAKVINFGILYGMGINALRANLGTSRAEAQEFYNRYFETFTELAQYLDHVKAEAARKGYTETLFGRKRYFEGLKSRVPYIRASSERMAINAPIQGTATADIVKLAMVEIDAYIVENKLEEDVYLLLQVHDELVYEVREDKVKKVVPAIKDIMESILSEKESHGVPIVANAQAGPTWGDMQSV